MTSARLVKSYLGGLEAFLADQLGLFVEGDGGELLVDASVVRRLKLHGVHFGNRNGDGLDSGRGHGMQDWLCPTLFVVVGIVR